MARTNLAVQTIARTGLKPTFTAANAAGHSIVNNGATTFIVVKNAGVAVDITVSQVISRTVDGVTPDPKAVSVLHGEEQWIGPWPKGDYDQSGGVVNIDFSAVADITCAAIQI